jgi:hypothetical protein
MLAPALVFIATACDRNYQTDLWHHLARGRALVEEGQLLDADRYTFTIPGRPFQDCNWLWQAAFYHVHRLGGLELVQTVNSLLLAAMMLLLQRLAWRRSGSLPIAAAASCFAFFGLWQVLIIRPQTFSLVLFVLTMTVLEAAQARRWLLALPPLLLALWANVHGGFPVGLLLVGAYAAGAAAEARSLRRAWPWALCLAGCALATFANPYSWRVYEYVLLTSGTASSRRIDEWLPPSPSMLIGKAWLASLVLLAVLLALQKRRPSWREVALLAVFLPLAGGSARMVAWWLLIVTPILAAQAANLWAAWRPAAAPAPDRPSWANAAACTGLLAVVVLSLPWLERINPVLSRPGRSHRTEQDLHAVAGRLSWEGGGRVFTRFEWGEYLGWELEGRCTVFMDGRIEIYPDEVWARYGAVTRGRADWQKVLDEYEVDYLVLDTAGYHSELLPQVERSRAFVEVMRQGTAVLYARRERLVKSP